MRIIRDATPEDAPRIAAFLGQRHAARTARLGELVHSTSLPALLAENDGRLEGVLTWIESGSEIEIHTLHATASWTDVGTALLGATTRRPKGACQSASGAPG
jgi:hypothetical protein